MLELKAFHNEEDGQMYANQESVTGMFNVYWNFIYTGTPYALHRKVNQRNFGTGMSTRLAVIPLPDKGAASRHREVIENAEEVLIRLENDTSLPDNRWRARSMLDMCQNLRIYMVEIAGTESYDERMELLERNIRGETGLTALIETYMHDFIDDEVQELSRIKGLNSQFPEHFVCCGRGSSAGAAGCDYRTLFHSYQPQNHRSDSSAVSQSRTVWCRPVLCRTGKNRYS